MKIKELEDVVFIENEDGLVDAYFKSETQTSHLVHIKVMDKGFDDITEDDAIKCYDNRHVWIEDFVDYIKSFRPRKIQYEGE